MFKEVPMPMSLNRAELIGRLGRAAELRFTAEGQAVATFSLATDRPAKAGTRSEADWHRVVCWGKLGEFAGSHLTKGRLVYVSGRLAYRSWEDKDGQRHRATEVVATDIILLDRPAQTESEETDQGDEDALPF
jgi:single-strand DNA-binding protein